jgi:hypothetical protein
MLTPPYREKDLILMDEDDKHNLTTDKRDIDPNSRSSPVQETQLPTRATHLIDRPLLIAALAKAENLAQFLTTLLIENELLNIILFFIEQLEFIFENWHTLKEQQLR